MSTASVGIRASKPATLPPGVPPGTVPLFFMSPYWPWRTKYLAPSPTLPAAGWSSTFTGGWQTGGFRAQGNTVGNTNIEYGVGPDNPGTFPVAWRPTIVMVISLTCNAVQGPNPFRARVRTSTQSVYSANLVPAGTANPYAIATINTAGLGGAGIQAFSVHSTSALQLSAANVVFVGYIGADP